MSFTSEKAISSLCLPVYSRSKVLRARKTKIAIGVLGNGCRVARHKPIKHLSLARRDPSSKLKLGRTPINFQSVFGGKPGFEDVELEWANDADEESGAIGRQEDLGCTFLG
jgi:hypothetical protein